jgi:aldehyde:ferredoxin oxidoreductase
LNKLLRVNMSELETKWEDIPDEYSLLGGRGITSRVVLDEVEPQCDPLGPNNKLVFAPGLLGGTTASSANRISIGAKSPLTGGIKESNGGGTTGLRLAQAGVKALIVEGAVEPEQLYLLVIHRGDAVLKPATELAGKTTSETVEQLAAEYGDDAAMSIIGQAGEYRLLAAGIANTDTEQVASRYCGRGGLGAVMGAKGLKAVVVVNDELSFCKPDAEEDWRSALKEYNRLLLSLGSTSESFPKYGTAATLEKVNSVGGLPTRNFSEGQFEDADNLSGWHMRELILERDGTGTTTHACMPGCVIRCSNRYPDKSGALHVSPMEYETNTLMGSNLGINSLDVVAELNLLCNEYGLDTIETGAALGVAMEAGIIEFGDADGAIELVHEIAEGTVLGKVIGNGAVLTGQVLGVTRVPAVRGQAMPAYDPRGIKGNGVTYATSPMGADHTAGNTIAMDTDHLDPEGKVEDSKLLQLKTAVMDLLGVCAFIRELYFDHPEAVVALVNARHGTELTEDDLLELGRQLIADELEFNRRAGLPEVAKLPDYFYSEELPPHEVVFDVDEQELAQIWKDD